MTRSVAVLVILLVGFEFSPGFGKSLRSPDDKEHPNESNGMGISSNLTARYQESWTWFPDLPTLPKIVIPDVNNFDDIEVNVRSRRDEVNVGALVGIIMGTIFGCILLAACIKLCCGRRSVTHGAYISSGTIVNVVHAPAQTVSPATEHYPPPPPAYSVTQPPYQPAKLEQSHYSPGMGMQNPGYGYSPGQQPYPVGVQQHPSPPLPFQQQQDPSATYGAPPTFKY